MKTYDLGPFKGITIAMILAMTSKGKLARKQLEN